MDSFNNCPVTKEEKAKDDAKAAAAAKEAATPINADGEKLPLDYKAHEKVLEGHFDKSYSGSLQSIQGQKRHEDELAKQWNANQKKWANPATKEPVDPPKAGETEKPGGDTATGGALAQKDKLIEDDKDLQEDDDSDEDSGDDDNDDSDDEKEEEK